MRSLAEFAGDALEAAVMRGNIRGRLFAAGPAAPARVGPFELRRQLGRGGMGVVFAAFDPRLKREVALKLVALDRFPGATGILAEAQALAAIDHANVVRVFSVGVRRIGDELHPRLYIAMERLHGRTLRGWVKRACPTPAAIVQAYVQAAHGLAAAHRAGVVHGDFKPDNAMIDDAGHVTTMDFSLALRDGPRSTTDRDDIADQETRPSWTLAGTPGYIAPELMLGDRPTPRSDQWALCASLLEALSGALPCAATLLESPRRLAARVQIPHRTAAALLRGLALDPRQRFPTTDALASALASAPARRRWLASIPPLGLGVAALWPGQSAPQCDDAASISDTWGPAERAAVRAGLAATGLLPEDTRADQVVAAFDGYADQLAAAGRRVCDAQRDESLPPHVADAQRSCVERGRRAMAANLEAAREPTAAQSGLIFAAIQRLPSLDQCFTDGDDEFPLPHDPSLVAAVQGVREDLAAAVVAAELGQRGTEPFAPLLERAIALGHPPLVAAVEVARARHEGVIGDSSLAIAGLELGHTIAVAHGMDGLAAHAATERAMLSVF
ncbi:MAG: serine/threonine protein kinase, partial [Myxococcales bacterium]|nr:serine/threonine protein kinase [Myxococcales bacterium]